MAKLAYTIVKYRQYTIIKKCCRKLNTEAQAARKEVRNIRDAELWNRLEARGDLDPADFLSSIVADPKEPKELRAQAANWLLPYKYAKRQAIPSPRHIEESIVVSEFTSVEIAESFLGKITVLVARGELDFQSGLELSAMTTAWINAQNARTALELKQISVEGGPTEQTIHITGGLPPLPGTQITMPMLDGHVNGHDALAPPVPQLESSPPKESLQTNGHGQGSQDQGSP